MKKHVRCFLRLKARCYDNRNQPPAAGGTTGKPLIYGDFPAIAPNGAG